MALDDPGPINLSSFGLGYYSAQPDHTRTVNFPKTNRANKANRTDEPKASSQINGPAVSPNIERSIRESRMSLPKFIDFLAENADQYDNLVFGEIHTANESRILLQGLVLDRLKQAGFEELVIEVLPASLEIKDVSALDKEPDIDISYLYLAKAALEKGFTVKGANYEPLKDKKFMAGYKNYYQELRQNFIDNHHRPPTPEEDALFEKASFKEYAKKVLPQTSKYIDGYLTRIVRDQPKKKRIILCGTAHNDRNQDTGFENSLPKNIRNLNIDIIAYGAKSTIEKVLEKSGSPDFLPQSKIDFGNYLDVINTAEAMGLGKEYFAAKLDASHNQTADWIIYMGFAR